MTLSKTLERENAEVLELLREVKLYLTESASLILVDDAAPSEIDGYPATASGGVGGGGGTSELTSTERGADRRMTARRSIDQIHSLALEAREARVELRRALKVLSHLGERRARLQTIEADGGNDSWCWHARDLGLPYDERWDRHCSSDLYGLWSEPRPVCRSVYDFVNESRKRNLDRSLWLPTDQQMRSMLERGVARMAGGRAPTPTVRRKGAGALVELHRGSKIEHVDDMVERFEGRSA